MVDIVGPVLVSVERGLVFVELVVSYMVRATF